MARIAGVDLPRNKRIEIALTYIYGIGRTSARKICEKAERRRATRRRISSRDGEVVRLREMIEREYKVEGDLRREVAAEHQDADGHRLLPRPAPSARAAGARPAHAHQRAHPQGSRARRSPARRRPRPRSKRGKPSMKKGAKKKVKKNVQTGVAHIQSTFNNTIITITDVGGQHARRGRASGAAGLQGLAQVDALRRAGRRRGVREEGDGARRAPARRVREGAGRRPRVGAARAPGRGHARSR